MKEGQEPVPHLDGIPDGQDLHIPGQIAPEFLDLEGQIPPVAAFGQAAHGVLPINGAEEGKQVLVRLAMIVLHVNGPNPPAEDAEILAVEAAGQVGVAEIVAYAHVMRILEGVAQAGQFLRAGAVDPLAKGPQVLKIVSRAMPMPCCRARATWGEK